MAGPMIHLATGGTPTLGTLAPNASAAGRMVSGTLGVRAIKDGGGMVMVAPNRNRTLGHKTHNRIAAPFGVRAIADDVAQNRDPVDGMARQIGQDRLKRLTVAVDIRQNRNAHSRPILPVAMPL